MVNINVPASMVWETYECEQSSIIQSQCKCILIAENQNFGVEIYLEMTSGLFPEIVVLVDDEEVEFERVISAEDCEKVASELYDKYLENPIASGNQKNVDMEAISDREGELDDAIFLLFEVFAPEAISVIPDIDKAFSDLKDIVCEYIYTYCDTSVYRPMILDDDSYIEFPYGEIELEWFEEDA